ncbi:MAG: hypothetical protein HYR73_05935 [Candidatus Eisenbacteria bacterium]|nr:hypothetical protein [Candidatus Eisenbacteria bacterium]
MNGKGGAAGIERETAALPGIDLLASWSACERPVDVGAQCGAASLDPLSVRG